MRPCDFSEHPRGLDRHFGRCRPCSAHSFAWRAIVLITLPIRRDQRRVSVRSRSSSVGMSKFP